MPGAKDKVRESKRNINEKQNHPPKQTPLPAFAYWLWAGNSFNTYETCTEPRRSPRWKLRPSRVFSEHAPSPGHVHGCLNSMGVFICPDFPKNLSRLFLSGFKWYIVSAISFVQAFVGFHFSLQCFPAMPTTLPDRVPSLEKLTLMPGVSRLGCLQAG